MALSEIDRKRVEKVVGAYIEKTRPPPHIRPELDISFRVSGQSVEIFEISPHWERPEETMEHSVAKATFTRNQGIWKVYWQRADLKWHRYEPVPEVGTLEEFLAVVEEDEYGCFWG